MSAAGPSNYEVFNIRKPKTGQVTGVEGRVLNFNYYESIYSPMITGRLMIEDTGGTIENEKGEKVEITKKINALVEKLILRDPSQWILTHNRWK